MLLPLSMDELVGEERPTHSSQNISVAIFCVLMVHVILLGYWQIDPVSRTPPRVIEVALIPYAKVDLIPAEKKLLEPVKEELPKEVEPSEKAKPLDKADPSEVGVDSNAEMEQTSVEERITPSTTIDLYTRSLEISRDLPERRRYKSFSTYDFPKNEPENGDAFKRVATLPVLISEQKSVSFTDNRGYTTMKTTDFFGFVRCLQQRPSPGDADPLWYPIPLSTCGHVK